MSTLEFERFDPREILAAFQRAEVSYVLIGGLARVIRGSDEITYGVDICPSRLRENSPRIKEALDDLGAAPVPAQPAPQTEAPEDETMFRFTTPAGPVNLVVIPEGVPKGYEAIRMAATRENLGGGIQPLVAHTADLITMAAATGRTEDLARLPELQHILKLETRLSRLVEPSGPRPENPTPERDRGIGI